MTAELLILRFIHVLGGVFWVGAGLFSTFFVMPALMKTGTSGPVFAEMQRRHLFTVMPTAAILTMLSGLRLMMIVSDGFSGQYFATRSGQLFAVAGVASVIAFLLALLVARPAGIRSGQLNARLAKATEAERGPVAREAAVMQRRSSVASAVAMTLLILAASGMAVARYV